MSRGFLTEGAEGSGGGSGGRVTPGLVMWSEEPGCTNPDQTGIRPAPPVSMCRRVGLSVMVEGGGLGM